MTTKEFSQAAREHKWGILVVAAAMMGWAVSLVIDDLRGKVDAVALLGTAGGLIQMWLQNATKRVTGGVSGEVKQAVKQVRRDLRRQHHENRKLIESNADHGRRLQSLEHGQNELALKVDRIVAKLFADDQHCCRCGVEIPPLGQSGHWLMSQGGAEQHFCEECWKHGP